MNVAQEYIVLQIRKELGPGEATEILIDWLLDAWQTFEALEDRFGRVRAMQIFTASSYFPSEGSRRMSLWEQVLSPSK